ncbi:hypothetical protein KNP414_00285 [Paenibacillus mucilaginosus KNP414]|uniref:Uncharacterized protein n=1 Tax=Paenibacillus mucilaginosus (strain KNP414) TaxID=1036673 RepID=F8FMA2_PAEMK|nr:hypothetical protein KNP414_00285 [Paenibacillus mucilaginosus KNP414]
MTDFRRNREFWLSSPALGMMEEQPGLSAGREPTGEMD